VNEKTVYSYRRKLNIEDINGIFPQDKFDVSFYMWDSGVPKFHIENKSVDLVFDIYNGKYLFKGFKTKDEKDEAYILNHFDEWYTESMKGHCINAWEYFKYEYIHHFDYLKKDDEFPWQITNMDISHKWSNKRTLGNPKHILNYNDDKSPFKYGEYDVSVYELEEGEPRFHVENSNVDLVFSMEDGRFLYRSGVTKDEETEKYILSNIGKWFEDNKNMLKLEAEDFNVDENEFVDPNIMIRNAIEWSEERRSGK
jgi:hypothetical protein